MTELSLTGVVTPADPPTPFTHASATARESLERCQSRLAELRASRSAINSEVAALVAEETALKRMTRIALPAQEAGT